MDAAKRLFKIDEHCAEWRISQLNEPVVFSVEISTSWFAKETMNFTMSG